MSTSPDRRQSIYACDCGYECASDRALQQHRQTNCRNRSVECSFCEETFPTSNALREHLILCGNKTDECPRCRQFIRRSYFAYHCQNNCLHVNDVDMPPNQRRLQIAPRSPVNPNLSVAQEDSSSDDDYTERGRKVQSAEPHKRPIQLIIRCEYCQQPCAQNDYDRHKINCLRNPANIKNRQQERQPIQASQNRSPPNGIVHIPCEICNASVDLPNWANHVSICLEREKERITNRARMMSAEPVIERFPCEYCDQLFPAEQFVLHEQNCQQNPNNKKKQAQNGRLRHAAILPSKYTTGNDRAARPVPQSPRDEVHYGKIDHVQTRKANGLPNRSQFQRRTNDKTLLLHRSVSAESVLLRKDVCLDNRIYDNRLRRSQSHAYLYAPVGSENFANRNNDRGAEKNGRKSGMYEIVHNDKNAPSTNRHKKPSRVKAFFGCTPNGVPD